MFCLCCQLCVVLSTKQAGQSVIDEYRSNMQSIHGWLDTIAKRIEVVDMGSGLDCSQKLAAIADIGQEFQTLGPDKVDRVKQLADQVINLVSNLDSQQIEEQVIQTDAEHQ